MSSVGAEQDEKNPDSLRRAAPDSRPSYNEKGIKQPFETIFVKYAFIVTFPDINGSLVSGFYWVGSQGP